MIDSKVVDGIVVLPMTHGKVNALDIEFCDALAARFNDLRKSDTKAVVLTGQGGIFSAGVDLKRLSAGGADYIRRFLPALHRLYEAVFFYPKPVIAAVNGHAIAGGCVLACAADRRVMARDAGRIGVTELLTGVPFRRLPWRSCGAQRPALFRGRAVQRYDLCPARRSRARLRARDRRAGGAAGPHHCHRRCPCRLAGRRLRFDQAADAPAALKRGADVTDAEIEQIWTAPETLARIRDYVARTLRKC